MIQASSVTVYKKYQVLGGLEEPPVQAIHLDQPVLQSRHRIFGRRQQRILPGDDTECTDFPVPDVAMRESTSAKRSLDTEDVHESTEPAREKRRLELLTLHVLMLHGCERD